VLKQVHADHSRDITQPGRNVAEMSKHCGGVVVLVDPFEPESAGEQSIAPGRVNKKAGRICEWHSISASCRDARTMFRVKCNVRDVRALNHVRAKPTAVIKQQLVEVGSSDLVAVADTQVRIVGETKRRGRPVLIRDELCSGFVDAYASDLVGHAQKIK
jgi:hypothetical protein